MNLWIFPIFRILPEKITGSWILGSRFVNYGLLVGWWAGRWSLVAGAPTGTLPSDKGTNHPYTHLDPVCKCVLSEQVCMQCTMLLQRVFRGSQNFKRKGLVVAQYWSKFKNSKNSPAGCSPTVKIFREKYFLSHICWKYVTYCQKTWRGCQINLKFCTRREKTSK